MCVCVLIGILHMSRAYFMLAVKAWEISVHGIQWSTCYTLVLVYMPILSPFTIYNFALNSL